MPILIVGYFCAVLAALALIAFPQLRRALAAQLSGLGTRGVQGSQRLARSCRCGTGASLQGLSQAARSLLSHARCSKGWLLLAAALVLSPPLLVLLATDKPEFVFREHDRNSDARIEALLAGEQLVAPEPLPPAVFLAREVERVIPEVAGASRNWTALDAAFRQRLLMVFKLMRERHGYQLVLLEGYRSPERQSRLAALGPQVTGAGAMMSYHQYGLAADVALIRNGRIVIDESGGWAARGYRLYGELAETVGLTWGGRWKMRDLGHVELRRPGVLARAPYPS